MNGWDKMNECLRYSRFARISKVSFGAMYIKLKHDSIDKEPLFIELQGNNKAFPFPDLDDIRIGYPNENQDKGLPRSIRNARSTYNAFFIDNKAGNSFISWLGKYGYKAKLDYVYKIIPTKDEYISTIEKYDQETKETAGRVEEQEKNASTLPAIQDSVDLAEKEYNKTQRVWTNIIAILFDKIERDTNHKWLP